MQTRPKEVWGNGAAYERYVGRWSQRVARDLIDWLAVPAARLWLDIGCGTGTLSHIILETSAPRRVEGVDRSFQYVAFARDKLQSQQWNGATADAQALPIASGIYDAVVSGLVLNFVPQPAQMVAEMARVARNRATVAAYVWDYADKMELMRYFWDAASELDADAKELDEGPRFPICDPQALADLFQSAGLKEVQARAIDVLTTFQDFDDYWQPFFGGQGPAPTYLMSLDAEHQNKLREHLRERLPIAADGSIPLIARAWAVRGTK